MVNPLPPDGLTSTAIRPALGRDTESYARSAFGVAQEAVSKRLRERHSSHRSEPGWRDASPAIPGTNMRAFHPPCTRDQTWPAPVTGCARSGNPWPGRGCGETDVSIVSLEQSCQREAETSPSRPPARTLTDCLQKLGPHEWKGRTPKHRATIRFLLRSKIAYQRRSARHAGRNRGRMGSGRRRWQMDEPNATAFSRSVVA
jgi:hypothetical protein